MSEKLKPCPSCRSKAILILNLMKNSATYILFTVKNAIAGHCRNLTHQKLPKYGIPAQIFRRHAFSHTMKTFITGNAQSVKELFICQVIALIVQKITVIAIALTLDAK